MTLRYRIRQWLRDYLGTGEAAERRSSIMFSQLNECATRKQLSAILAVLKEQNQAIVERLNLTATETNIGTAIRIIDEHHEDSSNRQKFVLEESQRQFQALIDRQQVMMDELVKMNGTLTAAHVMHRQPTVKEFAPDWDGAQLMALHELLSNPEKEN